MALKDTWKDKINGVDVNDANDINQLAKAIIEIENQKENGELDGFSPIVLTVPVLAQGATDYTVEDKANVQAVIDAVSASENPVVMLRSGTTLIPSAYYKQSATHYFVGISPDSFPGDGGEVWFTYVKYDTARNKLTANNRANAGDDGTWLEDIADLENDFCIPTNNLVHKAINLALENFNGGGGLNITDDGNGNVVITTSGNVSITDDGNGNVIIG